MVTVRMTVTVDHPEKRGPIYPVVPAGTKLIWEERFEKEAGAVGMFREVLAGQWDCGSEYVSRVMVTAGTPHSDGVSYRTVRREVRRARPLKVFFWASRSSCWTSIRRVKPSACAYGATGAQATAVV